jgi:photosystem II stability/assembly factor-like uncharacterized protein
MRITPISGVSRKSVPLLPISIQLMKRIITTRSPVTSLLAILVIMAVLQGCADRIVTDPDFRYDLNRPSVSHVVPVDGAINVPSDVAVEVWFSKLMNEGSIEANFFLHPVIVMDSLKALSVDPANSETIYAAGRIHGIFRSENGGESWRWMSKSVPDLSALSVLVGENQSYVLAGTNDGLYLTDDEGENWHQVQTFNGIRINHLVSDPSNSQIIYAAAGTTGVFKSEDGGNSWQQTSTGLRSGIPFTNIAVDPSNSSTLFVTTDNDFIYKSVNGGANWQQVRLGLTSRRFSSIAISPENPELIIAGSLDGGVFMSENAGINWIRSEDVTDPVLSISFDSSDGQIIYIGTSAGIHISTNSGQVWSAYEVIGEEIAVEYIVSPANGERNIVAALTNGAYKFNATVGMLVRSSNVELENIVLNGQYDYSVWRDTITVVSPIDYHQIEEEADTTTFSPFVPARALQAWIAQGRKGSPPVDVKPDATKLTFLATEVMLKGFRYRVLVRGTFEDGGNIPRDYRGAEDTKGNSIETDSRVIFTIEPEQ